MQMRNGNIYYDLESFVFSSWFTFFFTSIILATAGRTADLSTWVPSQSSTMDPLSITTGTLSLVKGLARTAHIVGKLVRLRNIPEELTKLSTVVRTPDICPRT